MDLLGSPNNMKRNSGMTLIEIILYIGIVGFMSTALMSMMMNIMSLKSKSVAMQEVNSSLRLISDKLNFEIKNAKSLGAITASSVTLNTTDATRNTTVFNLNTGNIRMSVGSSVGNLNSNLVNISAFVVTNLSSGDSKTSNINYVVTGNYINPGGRSEFNYSATVEGSAEVRSK